MTSGDVARRLAALRADREAMALLDALEAAGEPARIIGGAVRNALIEAGVTDIDITTTALPRQVEQIAHERGWKPVPTGIEHGTITVVIAHRPFEVTTLREDVATDGRRAEVRFGRDFLADAARRDFTINAMAMGRDGVLHDPFGGLADLAAGRVRFIGDPDLRLREDYLRGLRFLRFSASYARGDLDAPGLAAVLRNRNGFARLSRERIRQEVLKLLMAPRGLVVMEQAERHGVLSEIIGMPIRLDTLGAILRDGMSLFQRPADVIERLFLLFPGNDQPVEQSRESLRLSNEEVRRLERLVLATRFAREGADPRLVGHRYRDEAALALWLARGAEKPDAALVEAIAQARQVPAFLIRGEDLLRAGLRAGPEIGEKLAAIEALWIERGFPADQADQRALIPQVLGP